MGHDHDHAHADGANERSLWLALSLTSGFLVIEIAGGIVTGSLALISDAAHMFTDAAALAIALAGIRIARRPADSRRTFGYYRFEILAAAVNAVLLFAVGIYILVEAYQRLKHPPEIAPFGMLAIAAIGLCVNLVSMRLLSAGKEHSLNLKGAYLEVWSDMLGSIGVIAGALLIAWTQWLWVDSAVAIGIGLWVLPRTWTLLSESLNVLLEGVPKDVALDQIENALLAIQGVMAIHDLHVWALTSGKNSLTVHVVMAPDAAEQTVLQDAAAMLASRFDLRHTTIQVESAPCVQKPSDGRAHF